MGFNRRKLEDQRREAAEKEAANRRATDAQVLEDAERLITGWNERQAKRMPMLFSPTIGAAIRAGFWFLWVRCPACQTINAIDLRRLDRHGDAAVTSLIPALSCRSSRPNAPFAELVRLSRTSIADEIREEYRRRVLIRCYAFRTSSGGLAIFTAIRANNATMDTARLPENAPIPTHTNSFVIFVVLCLLIFALMAFAKFMERRERRRLGNP